MSKLILKDGNGVEHDVSFSSIKTEKLKEEDVIVAAYEVGNASPSESRDAIMKLKEMLQTYFPKNKIIVTAKRNGKEDVTLKVVSEEK